MRDSKDIRGKYRHYRDGKEYELIGVAKHSETLEDMAIYRALYQNDVSELWARPLEMFFGEVEKDGKLVPRFEWIDNPAEIFHKGRNPELKS